MDTPSNPSPSSTMSTTTLEPARNNGAATGTTPGSRPETLQAEASTAPPRRRWPLVVGAVAVLAGVGAVGWFVVTGGDGDTEDETSSSPAVIEATRAEVRDLIEYSELDGTLTYGESFMIGPRRDGTITNIVDAGDTVERGEVLWEVNELPTVLFYGTTPMYREATPDAEGRDVEMIEENLAALGYTADGTLVVDDVFDDGTTEAINEMQRDLGIAETGTLAIADVHVEAGPLIIDATSGRPGNTVRADTALVEASVVESTRVLLATIDGLVTDVATPGTMLESGTILYEVDTNPVPILIGEPIDRTFDIGVDGGSDIEAFKTILVELGFDADGELVIDDTWDGAAAEALAAWEEELGIEVDGILQNDQFVTMSSAGAIAETAIERGHEIVAGTAVATVTDPTQIVTTQIPVADRDLLAVGATVDVDLGDGETVSGTVTWVSSSSTVPAGQPDADPVFDVEITLERIPESFAEFAELDVTVLLVDDIAEGVVTVPASALISTGSSFAVEVVDGTSTRFVDVDTGMFADGWVEVAGIDAGAAVVVPS